MTQWEV